MSSQVQSARSQDQRSSERVAVRLAGKLFVPAEESILDCIIVNLSAGGASVHCPEPPLDAFVILYVDGFGRFDGVTTRYVQGELGLKFVGKDDRRERLEQDLESFVKEGMKVVTRVRRHRRNPVNMSILFFSCADGSQAACKLVDISFQGAMLKTHVRPPIGEIVHLGQTRGWVVRHHEQGIDVQFQQPFETGNGR